MSFCRSRNGQCQRCSQRQRWAIPHVERRVGEVLPDWHKIGLEVGMQIRSEAVGVARADVLLDNGEILC